MPYDSQSAPSFIADEDVPDFISDEDAGGSGERDLLSRAAEALGSAAAPFRAIGQAQVGGTSAAALTAMRNAGQVMSRAGVVPALTGVPGVPSIGEAVRGLTGIDPRSALSKPFAAEAPRNTPEAIGKAAALSVPAMVAGGPLATAAGSALSTSLSGGGPGEAAASAAFGGTVTRVLPGIATRFFRSAIKPANKLLASELRMGRDPVAVLRDEGVPLTAARSIPALLDWTKTRFEQIGEAIGEAVKNAPGAVPLKRLVDGRIDSAIRELRSGPTALGQKGREAVIAKLEDLREGLTSASPDIVLPPDAFQAKKLIGQKINWQKLQDVGDESVERVKRDIYIRLSKAIGNLSPELKALNPRYSAMERIVKGLEARRLQLANRGIPKSISALLDSFSGLEGLAGATAAGAGRPIAAAGSVGIPLATQEEQ